MNAKYQTGLAFIQVFWRKVTYQVYSFLHLCAKLMDVLMDYSIAYYSQTVTKSTKLGRIYLRKKLHVMEYVSPQDFVCLFRTSVQPEYVLRPNVTLYAITDKEAIFVETPQDINIYSSSVHPFFFVAQFQNATKVIKMSLRDFMCMADRIGDPSVTVIWISNTGRYGGTMLSQMFKSVPRTLLLHEPDPTTNLHFLRENKAAISGRTYERMLTSTIRILCKPHPGTDRICVKPRPQCSVMMRDITKLFPKIKQIFIYRNCLDTITSYRAIWTYDPFLVVTRIFADISWFSNLFPGFRNSFRTEVAKLKESPDMPQDTNTICVLAYMWVHYMLIARDGISRDQTIMAIKYEDFVSNPTEAVRAIFERLEINASYEDRAISTLSHDSQRGSVLSRNKLRDAKNLDISTDDRIKIDAILDEFSLPRLGEDFRL